MWWRCLIVRLKLLSEGVRPMKVLDLCSGIGGFTLAHEMVGGFQTIAFCEIEPFCQQVLRTHWSKVPIYDNIKTLSGDDIGTADVICGGIPCQPFSVAGQRKGEDDERHLWPDFLRLVRELRPAWCLIENVAGFVPMALDGVLSDLESAGYAAQAFVIPACAVDAPHRRDRVWVIGALANAGTEHDDGNGHGAGGNSGKLTESETVRGNTGYVGNTASAPKNAQPETGPSRRTVSESSRVMEHATGEGLHAAAQAELCGSEESAGPRNGKSERPGGVVGYADRKRELQSQGLEREQRRRLSDASPWADSEWLNCADGKARRVKPSVRLLANGIPGRVDKLRALGNAIVPQVAARFFYAIQQAEMGRVSPNLVPVENCNDNQSAARR